MPISQQDLWARYTAANPHWLTEGATLTPAGLKRLFDQTYELGHAQGQSSAERASDKFRSIFESVFRR